MSQRSDNNFLDPKTMAAIVFCAIFFFAWQTYLTKKYPDHFKAKPVAVEGEAAPSGAVAGTGDAAVAGASTAATQSSPTLPAAEILPDTNVAESFVKYESENIGFEISNRGMGIRNVQLNKYLDENKQIMTMGTAAEGALFQVGLVGSAQPLNFAVEKNGDNSFSGTAKSGDMIVKMDLNVDPVSTRLDTNLRVENAPADFKGVQVKWSEKRHEPKSSSFFMPSMNHQEMMVKSEGSIERMHPKIDESSDKNFKTGSMAAIGSQYFVSAMLDRSQILPTVDAKAFSHGNFSMLLSYVPTTVQPTLELHWISYVGGKSMAQLEAVDPELTGVVNLGFFGAIGKVLLKVLHWSYDLVGNWGWAIIVLTIIVRLIVLPFNVASYKSMKKMQEIQPQLASLRERYKEDPTALNRETMALMRTAKVNPIGGCLPILLQMPVFFALYQVLGQSIELYQAPFMFWIHDLSQKDPYYVLPALMGITMFIQQKITPTTMDPTQAKIMQWMPVIFSVFTLGLPSGLTLYIFISTLFGVTQQRVFMRDKSKAVALKGAKA